ncbi:MAG: hypothetical protein CMF96_10290 [Candidatus Marinimicrobia bacterium]|nr:hypothetical protein [Candidatus Neomarinimicrobiota bacterium]|tara:strand:+ start:10266 stop:11234 length:969 start_codon:yes stop_codon:yes gene_type:complete
MSIIVTKYDKSLKEEWNQFVENSDNGTLFHRREFLTYHIGREFFDHSLLFYKNKKLICIFSGAEIQNKVLTLYSHPGASYGGFVFIKYSFELVEEVLNKFEGYLQSTNIQEVFLVQPPSIYGYRYNETIEYALKWNNFSTEEIYISSVINLQDRPLSQIHKRKKRYLKKKLEEDFKLQWVNDFDIFYPILVKNKLKHGAKPTHSLEELKKLSNQFPEKLKLLILYFKNKPIGGTLNFVANDNVVIIFYNMIDYNFANKKPAIHLICETIKWAEENHFKWLDFGVSQLPLNENPLTPHKSLIQFKEQFGATGLLRRAYRKFIN